MKKIYKKRKDDAVSPVIATILMVAITVVLAAVLYVMVIGFGGTNKTAPVGAMSSMLATSNSEAKLTFGTFSPVPAPLDVKIVLTPSTVNATVPIIEYTFPNAPTGPTTPMTTSTGTGVYTDLNYGGNAINSGDYLTVTGLTPATTYTISIFHYPSDSVASMTGDITFQTPP